ncbi:MAG TPA: hypothetical protein VFR23_06445 [Jiangellaceae bacterium]|nr:hypothetical protein [Jiangellaceae bacterium]
MTEPLAPTATPPATGQSRPAGIVPGWAVWLLRVLVLLTAVLVFLQPVWAGLFVTGNVGMLGLHSAGHIFISLMLLLQIVAAVLVWRPGGGPSWPVWTSIGLFLLVGVQAGFGFARVLAVHIPVGVLTFGLTVAMLIAAWSPRLRVRRSEPRSRGATA